AVLLVDAVKGVQAQTLFNLEQAQKQGLKIIGAVNKIDLPQAKVEEIKKELADVLNVSAESILAISGKEGTNIDLLLKEIIEKVPAPSQLENADFKALVFDSKYDSFSGVIAYIRVFSGQIKKGEEAYLIATKTNLQVKEIGYFLPQLSEGSVLKAGEIGYIKTGIKEPLRVRVGDTLISSKVLTQGKQDLSSLALLAYQDPRQVLFLSLYTRDADQFPSLKDALLKLQLNDPALRFESESKLALGRGFRCGFLGALHGYF
ncbi:MAG: GTP-binding protein, partial [Candidatus Gribaldobacteria bacterium]|nr:GTP-binding protein [Candidatus Gribaldobacteria bacterium]